MRAKAQTKGFNAHKQAQSEYKRNIWAWFDNSLLVEPGATWSLSHSTFSRV